MEKKWFFHEKFLQKTKVTKLFIQKQFVSVTKIVSETRQQIFLSKKKVTWGILEQANQLFSQKKSFLSVNIFHLIFTKTLVWLFCDEFSEKKKKNWWEF